MPSCINGRMAAKFVTFEGGEGAGKSSQIRQLADRLTASGRTVVTTREPGGTATAESIRRLLLSDVVKQLGAEGEAVLFAAARADHVERVIRPELRAGKWVLCDRFIDSTRAYQGAAGGVDEALLGALDRVAVGRTMPNLTIVLDVPVEVGLARTAERRAAAGENPDRFERDDVVLHELRRQAFLQIAANEADRCVVIDANQAEDVVGEAVWRAVSSRLFDEAA